MKKATKEVVKFGTAVVATAIPTYAIGYCTSIMALVACSAKQYKTALAIELSGTYLLYKTGALAWDKTNAFMDEFLDIDDDEMPPSCSVKLEEV